MFNRKVILMTITMMSLLLSSTVYADDHIKGPRGDGMMKTLQAMGVDGSVLKQIKAITLANRKAQIPLKSAVELAKIELHELLDADEVSEAAVMTAIDKVSSAKTKVRKNQVRTMLKIRALLTPEQRKAVKQTRNQRRNKRKNRRRQRR